YFYDNWEHLAASYRGAMDFCSQNGISPLVADERGLLASHFDAFTTRAGVQGWSLLHRLKTSYSGQSLRSQYYELLRSGRAGLYHYLVVLNGACQVNAGALQATRQTELLSVRKLDVENDGLWLGLFTGKSGFEGHRHKEFIPIPKLVLD